jgi:hypothetical protein
LDQAFNAVFGILSSAARSFPMMDVVMLAIGVLFFALSVVYVYACDLL